MSIRLEHANLNVSDVDGVVRFLTTAFPDFRVRHDSGVGRGDRWVHVGTDDTYVSLYQADGAGGRPDGAAPGLNHLGYEVDDVEGVRGRLRTAGYRESETAGAHPHRRRVYFHDPDGNEWEFVQYLSDVAAERHDYARSGRQLSQILDGIDIVLGR